MARHEPWSARTDAGRGSGCRTRRTAVLAQPEVEEFLSPSCDSYSVPPRDSGLLGLNPGLGPVNDAVMHPNLQHYPESCQRYQNTIGASSNEEADDCDCG